MSSFYNIFIQPNTNVTDEQVEAKMNLALDWYRYSENNWLIKTSSDAAKWQSRLKSLVEPNGVLVILKIDPSDRQGWISKSFWDWYSKARENK